MSEFTRGVLFAVSMYVFGVGMYGLGRSYEQKRIGKELDKVITDLEKSIDETNEKLKEKGIES